MKKHIFFAKEGIFYRFGLISFSAVICLLPALLIGGLVSILPLQYSIGFAKPFLIALAAFICIHVIRCSFVIIDGDTIIWHDFSGKKRFIDINSITAPELIDLKVARSILFNSRGVDPLITNCMPILTPLGSFVAFENEYGRQVLLGTYGCEKFFKTLCDAKVSAAINNTGQTCENQISKTYCVSKTKTSSVPTVNTVVNMPIKSHISTYFKHFLQTVMFPLFVSAFVFALLYFAGVEMDSVLRIVGFTIVFVSASAFEYYKIIKITLDLQNDTLRLNIFSDNNKNVVKLSKIDNLRLIKSGADIEIVPDKKQLLITTPNFRMTDNVICFKTQNNTNIAISVDNYKKIYEALEQKEQS